MARRRYSFDEERIARHLKEGRGQGHGREYVPWLKVGEVPSRGRSHRTTGIKTGRIHHLLSDIECRLFLLLDWSDNVRDIREQFPLDRDSTRRIADSLGIRHPADPTTKTLLVMTTDFLVDVARGDRTVSLARTVKPSEELALPRTLEKFEIERRYWAERGVDWGIITERDLPKTAIRIIEWAHSSAFLDDLTQPYDGYYAEQAALVLLEIPGAAAAPLGRFCDDMDLRLEMAAGTCMRLVRHLLATKAIRCDMTQPIDESVRMARFTTGTAPGARASA